MGAPRFDDDDWDAKLGAARALAGGRRLVHVRAAGEDVIARVRATGAEAWVTVTSAEEARAAAAHVTRSWCRAARPAATAARGWTRRPDADRPARAAAADRRDAADAAGWSRGAAAIALARHRRSRAALALGASAPRSAPRSCARPRPAPRRRTATRWPRDAPTALTRAFSGRLARGIRNRFMDEHPDAPLAYPEIHYVTAPRPRRRAQGAATRS